MLNFCADARWTAVGTAAVGTAPGSVRVVLTCDASARAASILYPKAAVTGKPPVAASSVMVKLAYAINTQTRTAMIVPAVSD